CWFSSSFQLFIFISSQTGPQFLQTVAITAGHRVGRQAEQFTNFFKSMVMPKLQDDDFALFSRQLRQAAHGGPLLRRFAVGPLEPPRRFQFARKPAPETALVVERPIAKAAQAIVQGLFRSRFALQQRQERLLQDVLRLTVPKPQRAAVQNYLRRVRLVE